MKRTTYSPAPSTYARSLGYEFPEEPLRLGNQPLDDLLAVGDLVTIHTTCPGTDRAYSYRAIIAELGDPDTWTEAGVEYTYYGITYQKIRHGCEQIPRLLSGEALHRSTMTGYLDDLVAVDGRILSLYVAQQTEVIVTQRGAASPKQLRLF